MALLDLSEAEWDRALEWIAKGRDRMVEPYLDELRAAGAPGRVVSAVALGLGLPPTPDDPDGHRRGERIGARIELQTHLCDGGTASVYLALYGDERRPAAVRLRRVPSSPDAEAGVCEVAARETAIYETLSRCGAVPTFYESGGHRFADGSRWLYLCSEYEQGLDPIAHSREHQLDLAGRLYLFLQICDVVALLHERGLVHGDIKPPNFVVTRHDGRTRVWVVDLGHAAVQGQPWPMDGGLVGTAGYLSPERLGDLGAPAASVADVYALGLVLFELLEERPWLSEVRGSTAEGLERRLRELLPARTMRVGPAAIRDRLNGVLGRATAWRAEDRYVQVPVLRETVWEILKQVSSACHLGPAPGREAPLPYRGLRSFEEAHVEWFFGREAETRRLVTALSDQGIVTLIGASGSGKSSLLHAGVAPRVRAGAIDDRFEWVVLTMRPGNRPLRELALRLSHVIESRCAIEALEARLRNRDFLTHELSRAAIGGRPERRFLLLVDQLEEVFSQCGDASERKAFVEALIAAGTSSEARVRVLVALRTDFVAIAERELELWRAIGRAHILLEPMDETHLRSAIRRPAEHAALELEPGLEDLLVQAVLEEPGGLPLLQFVLDALCAEREGLYLTRAAYRAMGGLKGAVARRADAELDVLRAAGNEALVRRIFGRLVHPGDGTAPTRRRLSLRELAATHPAARAPLEQLIQARLLTADGDHVEFAHEALIREWPVLRRWIEEDREQLRVCEVVSHAAKLWGDRRDPADLLGGSRLRDALELRDLGLFSPDELEFLEASAARSDAAHRALEERRLSQLHALELRAQRNQLAAILALAMVLALGAVTFWLLRISEDQELQMIEVVQRANAYAVKGQAGAILDRVRERAQWVEQIALDPEVAALARAAPTEVAPALERHAEGRFDIVAVFDPEGIMTALWRPNRAVVGRSFGFRDYFSMTRRRSAHGVRGAYVAHSFLSENDGLYKFGISAPIEQNGEWAGLVLATVLTDSTLGPVRLTNLEDPRQTGVLVGPRDRDRGSASVTDADPFIVLLHDQLCSGCSVRLPEDLGRALRARFGSGSSEAQLEVPDVAPLRIDDYRDPVSGGDGRWLATFFPVGRTGFVVGVQTRYDAAIEVGERLELDLASLALRLAAIFVAGSLGVLGLGIWHRRKSRAAG